MNQDRFCVILAVLDVLLTGWLSAVALITTIKKLWRGQKGSARSAIKKSSSATHIPRDKHAISRKQISQPALKVLYRLKDAGYDAYLVGGGVRDLLLGREPKDFDIATNAKPEEVKQLFRNALLIGRRFKLVHVRFYQDIIEVATFRRDNDSVTTKETGLLVNDNQYGTIDDDVWRRDFTVNALYYNIADFSVVDYTNGIQDLAAGLIKIIGEPSVRYREDPVRMLRAIRFAAKLGFRLDEPTHQPFSELKPLLFQVSSARLFDESMKLFLGGFAEDTFAHLHQYDFIDVLLPELNILLNDAELHQELHLFLKIVLRNTDSRIREDKPVTPTFLFAAFLWYPLVNAVQRFEADGLKPFLAYQQAHADVIKAQVKALAIPRRCTTGVQEIWSLQWQMAKRQGRRAFRVIEHPRFRAAYDFLLIRAQVDPSCQVLADWWTAFIAADAEGREDLVTKMAKRSGTKTKTRKQKSHER